MGRQRGSNGGGDRQGSSSSYSMGKRSSSSSSSRGNAVVEDCKVMGVDSDNLVHLASRRPFNKEGCYSYILSKCFEFKSSDLGPAQIQFLAKLRSGEVRFVTARVEASYAVPGHYVAWIIRAKEEPQPNGTQPVAEPALQQQALTEGGLKLDEKPKLPEDFQQQVLEQLQCQPQNPERFQVNHWTLRECQPLVAQPLKEEPQGLERPTEQFPGCKSELHFHEEEEHQQQCQEAPMEPQQVFQEDEIKPNQQECQEKNLQMVQEEEMPRQLEQVQEEQEQLEVPDQRNVVVTAQQKPGSGRFLVSSVSPKEAEVPCLSRPPPTVSPSIRSPSQLPALLEGNNVEGPQPKTINFHHRLQEQQPGLAVTAGISACLQDSKAELLSQTAADDLKERPSIVVTGEEAVVAAAGSGGLHHQGSADFDASWNEMDFQEDQQLPYAKGSLSPVEEEPGKQVCYNQIQEAPEKSDEGGEGQFGESGCGEVSGDHISIEIQSEVDGVIDEFGRSPSDQTEVHKDVIDFGSSVEISPTFKACDGSPAVEVKAVKADVLWDNLMNAKISKAIETEFIMASSCAGANDAVPSRPVVASSPISATTASPTSATSPCGCFNPGKVSKVSPSSEAVIKACTFSLRRLLKSKVDELMDQVEREVSHQFQ